MMKRRLFLYFSSVLLLCCVGCKKEEIRVVEVSMQSFTTPAKVYLDNDYRPVWHEGDAVCVNGQQYEVDGGTVVVPNMGDMYALYPAADKVSYSSGSYQVELPRVQSYATDNSGKQRIEALMAACGRGSQLTFVNLCSLLKVVVPEGVSVLNIDVNTTDSSAAMSGKGSVTFVDNVPQFAFNSGDTYPYTRLDCGRTGASRPDRTYYIVVPPFENKRLTITVCGFTNGKKFRHTFTQQTEATLLRSQYAPSALPAYTYQAADSLYADTDVLCEPFSVTASRKRYFSKGNLQYCYTEPHWHIASHQYDVIGMDNNVVENINEHKTQPIDLFGWGTSGLVDPLMPWESRLEDSIYKLDDRGIDNMTASTDWGTNLGDWITPTKQYLEVMLQKRPHASDKAGMAVIDNTHHGLLVLPDYWVLPNGCSFSATAVNQYTYSQWNAMEAAGALFLPAAGRREGDRVMEVETNGYYWSGTRSYSLQFGNTPFSIDIIPEHPHLGYSVRLVK